MESRAYYIDITETLTNKLNTGIQRVVRNVARRKSLLEKMTGVECHLIWAQNQEFFLLENIDDLSKVVMESSTSSQKVTQSRSYEDIVSALFKKVPIIKPVYGFMLYVRAFLKGKLKSSKGKNIKFQVGDVLILLDSFWGNKSTLMAVEEARSKEVKIISVIYDIIPILYPNFVQKEYAEAFPGLLKRALRLSDGIMTLSDSSRKEIENYIREYKEFDHLRGKVDYFHLGNDFHQTANSNQTVNPDTQLAIDSIFTKGTKSYLMVGTIEPRKGHKYVVDSFNQYWESGGDAKLVIVGKYGWMYEDIKEAIESSEYFNSKLFVLNRITDFELGKIYELSNALIMASYTEGFGLPLVEAIQFGKAILASDIPVFKEIGQSYPEYFSLNDRSSLVELLRNEKIGGNGSAKSSKDFTWPNWDQTAEVFYTRSLKLIDK